MNLWNLLDIVLLVIILLCAGDALRQLDPLKHPVRSVAFGLVTIGSFGWITHDLGGASAPWWALVLHAGFAVYALILFAGRNPLGIPHIDPTSRPRRPSSLQG